MLAETNGATYLVGSIAPVGADNGRLGHMCPLCPTIISEDTTPYKRGCVQVNKHVRDNHGGDRTRGIVWRALYLHEDRTQACVVTHPVYYPNCEGDGEAIDCFHTLDPNYVRGTVLMRSRRASRKRTEPEPEVPVTDPSRAGPSSVAPAPPAPQEARHSEAAPSTDAPEEIRPLAPASGVERAVAFGPMHDPGFQAAVAAARFSKVKIENHGYVSKGYTMEFSPPSPRG